MARNKYETVKFEFEIENKSGPPRPKKKCVAELDHGKLRFEILSKTAGQVVIRDGDEFKGHYRGANNDVALYDTAYAVDLRGDLAFDPRVLGTDELMLANITVDRSIGLGEEKDVRVVGSELVNGVATWRVTANLKNEVTIDYWIEEESFRVHRKLVRVKDGLEISIDSTFSKTDRISPFPINVEIRRQGGKKIRHYIYSITAFDLAANIHPDRFSLKSMDLSINTMIVDYRLKRVVGYWDGEAVSKNPVQQTKPVEAASIK